MIRRKPSANIDKNNNEFDVSCSNINKLEDIDLNVLKGMIDVAVKRNK